MLSVIDGLWKDHLLAMDHLKEGIGLRGYAQQDPLVAYKRESFDMFEAMMLKFQEDTVRFLFRMQIIGPDGQPVNAAPQPRREIPAAPPVAVGRTAAGGRKPPVAGARGARAARDPGAHAPAVTRPLTRWKRSSPRRSSASWRTPAWQEAQQPASPPSATPARKWAATTPALAAPARSTKSATEQKLRLGSSRRQKTEGGLWPAFLVSVAPQRASPASLDSPCGWADGNQEEAASGTASNVRCSAVDLCSSRHCSKSRP